MRLAGTGFDGRIAIEDGMSGMDEMKASVDFLNQTRHRYCGGRH